MKKIFGFFIVMALLFSTVFGLSQVSLASANPLDLQYLPKITIKADGTITGNNTESINRIGRTFTLTANIEACVLVIECSNILLDGQGNMINATKGDNPALQLRDVMNVTVKKLEIFSRYNSIHLSSSSHCVVMDVKTNNRIYVGDGSNFNTIINCDIKRLTIGSYRGANDNLIFKNTITEIFMRSGSNNRFYQNNFLLEESPGILFDAFWDNGHVGNYWGNYSIKYPNASEIDNTGIGDTWYFIERDPYSIKEYPASCIDHCPLMYPWGTPELTVLEEESVTYAQNYPLIFTINKPVKEMSYSLDGKANTTLTGNITLNGLASGLHDLTIYATDIYGINGASKTVSFEVAEPFPLALIEGVSAASVVGVAAVCVLIAGLLVYFKKRKR